MQPTKPSYPVKDKNSADPAVKRWRDIDANEILDSFEKVDENFESIPDYDEYQFAQDGENGPVYLKSIYKRIEGSVVSFDSSGLMGAVDLPVYDTFTISPIPTSDDWKNEVLMLFSCDEVPSIISSPPSYLNITGSILTGYENLNLLKFEVDYKGDVELTITQLADANEDPEPPQEFLPTAGFTVLFDQKRSYGSETAPIYYTLQVSLDGAVDGTESRLFSSSIVIPEFLVDNGEEPWGTKPEWLIVTGDAYLEGDEHLNILKMTYHEEIEIETVPYENVVVCEIEAIEDGNLASEKPLMNLLMNLQFNENGDLGDDPDLFNDTIWSNKNVFQATIDPPTNAVWVDLGGGNYSLRTNTSGNNTTGGIPIINTGTLLNRILARNQKVTYLVKWRRLDMSSSSTCYLFRWLNSAGNDGVRFQIEPVDGRSAVRMDGSNFRSNISSVTVDESNWMENAWTVSRPDNRVRHYIRALDQNTPISFTFLHENITVDRPITSDVEFAGLNLETPTGGKRNNVEFDYAILINDELPSATIQSIVENPQNVKSILQTYYSE